MRALTVLDAPKGHPSQTRSFESPEDVKHTIRSCEAKRAAAEGLTDIKNSMLGYVIVQAESHEAAAQLFKRHPHFTLFPGDSVEIMECLPLPGR